MKKPLILISIFYFITRLINLTLLPVFSDEALYMFWGWQVWEIPGRFWHPLTDAKQPFLMWLFGLGQMAFPDPLFGTRLVSVLTGLLSLIGLWKLCSDFFDRKVAFLVAVAYCLVPIFLFFDRQGLMESAVAASAIWSLYFLLHLLEKQNLKNSLLLGFSLGLGFFTKSSALIFLVTTIVIICLKILTDKKSMYSLLLSQITVLGVFVIVNLPLFFQPLYWATLSTNSRWIYKFSEIIKFPVSQWLANAVGNTQIAFLFLTPLVFIFTLFGIRSFIKTNDFRLKTILLWFLISSFLYLISLKFMNFMSMRYLTPFLPPALIFAGFYLSQKPKWLSYLAFTLPAVYSLLLLLNPIYFFRLDSKINRYSYISGYLTGADTGYEVNEIVKYFKGLSKDKKINVTTAVHTFNPESGVWNYLRKNPNITIAFLDSRTLGDTGDLACFVTDHPTYFMAKLNDTAGLEKFFDKVTVITNPYNSDYSTVYTLKANCTGPSATLNLSTY